jgi:type IV pilus assembly protein PilX
MYKNNQSQAGLVLPMVLIFLVVMMLLGTAAIRNVTLEEKVAGNLRNRNVAFQAAEQALRYCENSIQRGTTKAIGLPISVEGPVVGGVNDGKNYWDVDDFWNVAAKYALMVPASPSESSKGAPVLASRPLCMAELIPGDIPSTINTAQQRIDSGDKKQQFRITARGYGLDKNTVVQLQSYLIF